MPTNLKIISHELMDKEYLRLYVVSGSQPCGTIDLISEKINFNIVGKYFFKGMSAIKNIALKHSEERLVFKFGNSKSLSVGCDMTAFTAVSMHIKSFQ
ncbi:hypothetical protein [Sphingobacterium sp. SYP-B4668]|uniref:hypothetical protein n=1 Tax=Sphingobacterium sp. SYP-B4668 TaxID=2996035 RepID=UPI0022DE20B8|nr:hypothetical protein [Sphingobacterium sp. SYP-B4668]